MRWRRAACSLAGLEHMDERYLRAVGYSTKSKRGACRRWRCSAISSVTMIGGRSATSEVVRIANARSGEGFIAVKAPRRAASSGSTGRAPRPSPVIPTHSRSTRTSSFLWARMGEYTDAIERINIEFSISNKLKLIDELEQLFASPLPLAGAIRRRESAQRRQEGTQRTRRTIQQLLSVVRARWSWLLANLDELSEAAHELELSRLGIPDACPAAQRRADSVRSAAESHAFESRGSARCKAALEQIFGGQTVRAHTCRLQCRHIARVLAQPIVRRAAHARR
jgi:FAD/FMN-containing dehydrogenase